MCTNGTRSSDANGYRTKCGAKGCLVPLWFWLTWHHFLAIFANVEQLKTFYLEAYVDDIVIKSKDEKMLLANVAETFDNLRKINMKLNPKKCSFGVEEGKFLSYMVSSEAICANPKKTRILADLQSPRMLKEMQSLAEKLAALNRSLSADEKMHHKPPIPHPTVPKETLYAYLLVSKEAVSFVLLTDQKEKKQSPIQVVSHTLNEAERNYAPMEKLALSLVYMTRRYFEAHLVKVIINQPIKQILRKTEAFRLLPKYVVELGDYDITFEPRNAVKGQVLADFITEMPDGEASSSKGSRAGSVLISPSGVEHTYALRLTFDSTNNEAEYEALLAMLRIAKRINIQRLEAKVDSKLVANRINGNYIASCDNMMKYLAKAKEYIACFRSFFIKNISRNQNQKDDALSKLASVAFNHLTKEVLVEVLNERSTEVEEVNTVVEEKGDN
ncbi:reverse transcriptase domain-containing protein [Tanacetum coccineum]